MFWAFISDIIVLYYFIKSHYLPSCWNESYGRNTRLNVRGRGGGGKYLRLWVLLGEITNYTYTLLLIPLMAYLVEGSSFITVVKCGAKKPNTYLALFFSFSGATY